MNKYLREVEITASNHFGKEKKGQFVAETRQIVSEVNARLGKRIRAKYGKFAVFLWPQAILEKHALPTFEYDTMSGVCVNNIPFELDDFFLASSQEEKDKITFEIFQESFSNLPMEVGIEDGAVNEILNETQNQRQ